MQIKFLGTGGAFQPHKGNSAAIIEQHGKNILIDCGYSTFAAMMEKNIASTLDYVLITHTHADHVGSLPTLLAYYHHVLQKPLPIISPTDDFSLILQTFLDSTLEGKRTNFVPITEFADIGYLDTFGQHVADASSYAYYFTEYDSLIYYSGDLGNADTTATFLKTRTEKNITVFHDTSFKDLPVHANYLTIQEKLAGYNVYGYHCDEAEKPDNCTIPLVEEQPELIFLV